MKKVIIDSFFGTLFVFATLLGIREITQLNAFNAFDPLGKSLGDVELTDIAFSQLRSDPPLDTNIIIVNIGNLDRGGIGEQIHLISQFHPKVIGLDIIFSCTDGLYDSINCPQYYDTVANNRFARAIRDFKNVVLVKRLAQTDSLVNAAGDIDIYDSMEHTDVHLRQQAYEGYANLETEAAHQEDLKSCRRFNPVKTVRGEQHYAFSVMMAMLYDSIKTKRFLEREKESEIINYKGNIVDWHGASNFAGRYMVLDWDQALDTTSFVPEMLRGKIVILGSLGRDLRDTSWDDKFFTPLNKNYAGKSRPDMYGVVVHANIVSMILNEDYVNELAYWQELLIAALFVFLNLMLFYWINAKVPVLFDTLSIFLQLAQVVLLSILMIEFFDWFTFKLNLTTTLAGVALVGTCFEIYNSGIKSFFRWLGSKLLTKRMQGV
jgi:CHASE2 domain-containing sensor protein